MIGPVVFRRLAEASYYLLDSEYRHIGEYLIQDGCSLGIGYDKLDRNRAYWGFCE